MSPFQVLSAEGIRLWWLLVREAGKRHALSLAGLALLGTLLEAGGLGLAVAVLLGGARGWSGAALEGSVHPARACPAWRLARPSAC